MHFQILYISSYTKWNTTLNGFTGTTLYTVLYVNYIEFAYFVRIYVNEIGYKYLTLIYKPLGIDTKRHSLFQKNV